MTIGAAEANQIVMQTMLEPGTQIASLNPTYKQVWGIAENHGHEVKSFSLNPDKAWSLNIDEFKRIGKWQYQNHCTGES
ncbi:MAG: hypothetical protein CM1200mP40_03850 [Gammaproteobacteria bacterium]|nr:MAG: hypothetical protein CM1200mP40_03850 [Gammaproteobacteria bacterium]